MNKAVTITDKMVKEITEAMAWDIHEDGIYPAALLRTLDLLGLDTKQIFDDACKLADRM